MNHVAFDLSGNYLAVAADAVKCYTVKTWAELKVLYNHTAPVMDVGWGPAPGHFPRVLPFLGPVFVLAAVGGTGGCFFWRAWEKKLGIFIHLIDSLAF